MNEAIDHLIRYRAKKRDVIDLLLDGKSVEQAAQTAGVTEIIVDDWIRDSIEFRETYARLRQQRIEQCSGATIPRTLEELDRMPTPERAMKGGWSRADAPGA